MNIGEKLLKDIPNPPNTDAALDALGKKLLEIMRLLVVNKGDIIVVNNNIPSLVTLAYDLQNKRLFNMFVHIYTGVFDIVNDASGQVLLTKMVISKDMVTLKVVLDKCVHKESYEIFLLNLALSTLTFGMKNHFKMIVEKCKNKDIEVLNGEIFLARCFKEKVKEDLLNDVIESDYFDINKVNKTAESPLMLACDELMIECVKLLLSKGSDKSYKEYSAIDIVVERGNSAKGDGKVKRKFIFDLMCGKNEQIKGKLQLTEFGFIDVKTISTVTSIDSEIKFGSPIMVKSKGLSGQVKWLGTINDHSCVGIELDHNIPGGGDGVINDHFEYQCTPGHGILTTVDNIKLDDLKKGRKGREACKHYVPAFGNDGVDQRIPSDDVTVRFLSKTRHFRLGPVVLSGNSRPDLGLTGYVRQIYIFMHMGRRDGGKRRKFQVIEYWNGSPDAKPCSGARYVFKRDLLYQLTKLNDIPLRMTVASTARY